MKTELVGSLVSFLMLISGNVFAAKGHGSTDRSEALALPDVSKDNGMYFYCEADKVIIQNCAGKATKPGKGCDGERRQVKKDDFFNELLSQITVDNAGLLNPLTRDDVVVLDKNKDPKELKNRELYVKNLRETAEKVAALLEQIGEGQMGEVGREKLNQTQERNSELLKLINKGEADLKIVLESLEKRDNLLKGVVEKICDSKVTINLNSSSDNGTLLHTVLKRYDPTSPKKQILLDGKLEAILIGKDASGRNQVKYCDTTTKLCWHDIHDSKQIKSFWEKMEPKPTFDYEGKKYRDYFKAAEALCRSLGLEVPGRRDFLNALGNKNKDNEANQKLRNLPGMDKVGSFWTSDQSTSHSAWFFNTYWGNISSEFRDEDEMLVRCVSRDFTS